jgi:prevent-host-death family protein
MTTGPVTETREKFSEIIENVVSTGQEYTVTKHGKPIAVLIGYEEYEALIETLNILSDDESMSALAEAESDIAEGRVD